MRDRDLVRLYWPADLRPAFDALFAIEDAMADVVIHSTQPALGAIKLAWWRERLEDLDDHKVPAEPRLQAAAGELLPLGVSGSDLARLEEGWAGMLHETPDLASLAEHGARLFRIGARLLNVEFDDQVLGDAGRLFAPVDAARRGIVDPPAGRARLGSRPIVRRARALTGLAILAARDLVRGDGPFEAEATPGRALALLRHRMTGRFPR